MATTSGFIDNQLNTLVQGDDIGYHAHPVIRLTIQWQCDRPDPKSTSTHWTGVVSATPIYREASSYGYKLTVYIRVGGVLLFGDSEDPIINTVTQWDVPVTRSFDGYVNIDTTSTVMNIEGNCTAPGCVWDETWHDGGVRTDNITLSVPEYNPYTAPTFKVNNYTQIGKLGITDYNVNYTIQKGTNELVALSIVLLSYKSSTWSPIWEQPIGNNNSGTFNNTYTLTSENGFANGSRYSMKMYLSDGVSELLSPGSGFTTSDAATVYTYQKPTINTSVSMTNTTLSATMSNTFTISGINNRVWYSYENDFKTQYRIKRGSDNYTGWTSLGNISSWSRTADQMRTLVPSKYDNQTITIQFRRYSPSADWYSDNTAQGSFTMYYRPQQGVLNSNVSYRINNSSGTILSKNQLIQYSSFNSIYVSWVYDTSTAKAGYISGYRVRLYDADQKVVKTYYTTNKYYNIPKSDIPRLQNTYIDITPYYNNGSTDPKNYWYYTGQVNKLQFVRVIDSLATPVITYPINNSNWINQDFRVCFTLPEDGDYGYQDETTYHYEDIELKINDTFTIRLTNSTGHTSTGTNLVATQCFNALPANLTYKRNIIIYPKLASGFPFASSYKLQVRVKKKYFTTSSMTGWSSWSSAVTVSVSVPSYNVNTGDLILASHFNNTLNVISRMVATYNVSWSTKPDSAVAGTTIIDASDYNYNNMIGKINDVKTKVNTFGTFDTGRTTVKFDDTNNISTSFTPVVQELITAQANENNSPNGRNYIKIIYDNIAYLK